MCQVPFCTAGLQQVRAPRVDGTGPAGAGKTKSCGVGGGRLPLNCAARRGGVAWGGNLHLLHPCRRSVATRLCRQNFTHAAPLLFGARPAFTPSPRALMQPRLDATTSCLAAAASLLLSFISFCLSSLCGSRLAMSVFPPLPSDSDSDGAAAFALPSDPDSDDAALPQQNAKPRAQAPRPAANRRRPAKSRTPMRSAGILGDPRGPAPRGDLRGSKGSAPSPRRARRWSPPPSLGHLGSTRGVLLELFAGTGSVGKSFASHGWLVVSLDITDKGGYTPTLLVNILHWAYKDAFPKHHFRVVWASPPCEHYSLARTTAATPRDLPFYDSLVRKSLEIVEWFQPEYYFIENPASGLLRTRPVIQGEQWLDVDYCMYGCEYRKRTRLWGVFPPAWTPLPLCRGNCWSCTSSGTGRHRSTAQRGSGWSLNQLHHIPSRLMDDIVKSIG